jgi:hypothetical protein
MNNTLNLFKESICANWAIFATHFSADVSKTFGEGVHLEACAGGVKSCAEQC